MSSTVAFRCDIGPSQGIGHVMRCLALGEEFADRGHRVVFVADLDSVPWVADQVRARGFAHRQPPPTYGDEATVIAQERPALVVIDSYVLPVEVYAAVRATGVRTAALVDGDPGGRTADVLIDQNIGAEDDTWMVGPKTRRLAGLEYALIRSELRSLRPAAPVVEDHATPRVLAFFGGTDATGAAPVAVELLASTDAPFHATVVAANERLADDCRAVTLATGQQADVVGVTSSIGEAVAGVDLVVGAAGTSTWELFCLGAATALLWVVDNQLTSYERAVASDLTQGLGGLDDVRTDPRAATARLREVLLSPDRRTALRDKAWRTVDGQGRARVADACLAP